MDDEIAIMLAQQIADVRRDVGRLAIWQMAAKDVIGRLMSYAALGDVNPDSILRHFSESGDYVSDKLIDVDEDFESIAERMRREKDWLVSYARSLLREEGEK
jgi:hypothetical protein